MRSERGSASIEMVLMTPLLLVLLMFVVAGGRTMVARGDVDAAARDGARAATLARSSAQAAADATSAVNETLNSGNIRCKNPNHTVTVGSLEPGSTVTVTVTCDVSLSDLSLLPVPTSRTLTASFEEVVDRYRQVGA